MTLSLQASQILNLPSQTAPSYPTTFPKTTPPPSEPLLSERYNAAAQLLCRAAGIFEFWAEDPEYGSQKWLNLPGERPPEVLRAAGKALSL
ncbi:hypothetical protein HK097_002906, partial [Rhizophlyctis rosea]